jgi:hypothetical protein
VRRILILSCILIVALSRIWVISAISAASSTVLLSVSGRRRRRSRLMTTLWSWRESTTILRICDIGSRSRPSNGIRRSRRDRTEVRERSDWRSSLFAFRWRSSLDWPLCIFLAGNEFGQTTFDPRSELVDSWFTSFATTN